MQSLIEKAQHIRLLILDVDGVLTTGALFYDANGIETKAFHVHDGVGMKQLLHTGVHIAIITSRRSEIVTHRMQDLGIEYVYQGQSDKVIAYDDIKQKLKLTDQQIAYVGDDLPDLPVLRRVGFSITVANAPEIMHQYANWTTKAKGGKGAAREVCDFIMKSQGTYQVALDHYLQR